MPCTSGSRREMHLKVSLIWAAPLLSCRLMALASMMFSTDISSPPFSVWTSGISTCNVGGDRTS